MFEPTEYELLDFGAGRKLERFGPMVLDRPCPAAARSQRCQPSWWRQATLCFQLRSSGSGHWQSAGPVPESWRLRHDRITLQLRPAKSGHVGVFAEQAPNWDWISQQVRAAGRPLRILNLFAYTGGGTLAAAAAGAGVVHVDAARNVVAWARRNAELSGLSDAPIRWIVDDARKFVDRESKRKNQYDAIILDPPSYGHGAKGEAWKLDKDLWPLLRACRKLMAPSPAFLLLTCHTPGFGPAELSAMLEDAIFGHCQTGVSSGRLSLCTSAGRRLRAGCVARWPSRRR